ncbi:MAG: nucleoid-associated protein [Candidatus Promineifilaceae bacterium]
MLTIDRLVIHKVDHRSADAPQLSDLESPLSPAVAAFLAGHIQSNREHKNARTAVFLAAGGDPGSFSALAGRLFDHPDEFVDASREMARLLFAAVAGDRRISPSDLFVCQFREDGLNLPQLALLKMEPQASFAGDFEQVNGGRRFVLSPVDNVMPTGELQKSAFVLPPAERARRGYDLRVVDQQVARFGARRPVASFFTTQFLGCQVVLNDADLSRQFYYGSHGWLKEAGAEWTPLQTAVFNEALRASLLDVRVDLDAFASRAIEDPAQQADYLEAMVEGGMTQLSFAPDEASRQRWAAQRVFSGDNNLWLRVDAQAVGPGLTVDPRRNPATGLWTVTITTDTWQEEAG